MGFGSFLQGRRGCPSILSWALIRIASLARCCPLNAACPSLTLLSDCITRRLQRDTKLRRR